MIIGIDLGTTNSLAAAVVNGQPAVLPDPYGRGLVPSVVAVPEADAPLVGHEALDYGLTHPERLVYSAKRLIGKGLPDVESIRGLLPFALEGDAHAVRVRVGATSLTPVELSGQVLARVRAIAESRLGQPIDQAVITVPAYFDDAQRQATVAAASLAGLEALRLVNEPTAACLAYGLERRRNGTVAVYDLGGGTFDVSVLRLVDGVFEVLATCGDTALGGDDLDRQAMAVVADQVEAATGVDLLAAPMTALALRQAVKAAKEALSACEEATLPLQLPDGRRLELSLALADLEALARPIIERTLAPCRQALADAGLGPDGVDEVVLVGGATRMPLVKRMVAEFFGQAPYDQLDPDTVVALGAAVQAHILSGGHEELLLLDVAPLSLGLETMGGLVETLIPRNTTVPTSAKETFTTFADNQTAVEMHVVQGERELAEHNRSLARFRIPVPPQAAGLTRLEVKFAVDVNGLLTVTATDMGTGASRAVTVRPTFGLTEGDVAGMVQASVAHAEADAEAKGLVDVRLKAEALLRATEKALAQSADVLDPDVAAMIEGAAGLLRQAAANTDAWFIRECMDKLEGMTEDLAGQMVGAALNSALHGV